MPSPYHYRDHFDALEDFVRVSELVWKNDQVRKSDTGRAVSVEKTYLQWVGAYRGTLPPLSADQFRELLEEITQAASAHDEDEEARISVDAFVLQSLEACDIQYNHGSRTWEDSNGLSQKYSTLEARILEAYYHFRDVNPWVIKRWPEKRVQLTLQRIYESYGSEIIRALREKLVHVPENREDGEACLRWVLEDILQVHEPETAVPVFLDWLWQVKLFVYGLPVPNPLLVNLYGGVQGCGKSQLVAMLMGCRGLFRGLLQVAAVNAMADSREMDLWSSNYIIFFDELAFTSEDPKQDGRNLAAFKQILTSQYNTRRDLGKNTHSRMRRVFSAISASNVPLCQRLYDPTGMRRFFELVVQRQTKMGETEYRSVFGHQEQELGSQPPTAMDPLLIWQAVDERRESGYITGEVRKRVEEIQASYRRTDAIDLALMETSFEIPHPVDGPTAAQILKDFHGIRRAGVFRDQLEKEHPDLELVRVSVFRKKVVEWLREQDAAMVRFVPQHDGLIYHLQRKKLAVFELAGLSYMVCHSDYQSAEGENSAPL